jgi:hypothetical protein
VGSHDHRFGSCPYKYESGARGCNAACGFLRHGRPATMFMNDGFGESERCELSSASIHYRQELPQY